MRCKINWDALGITTSLACAIHCALLPLFLTSLPLFGVNIIENPWFEGAMMMLAFCIGIYSLQHGRKKHHHRWLPIGIFGLGILFLFAKFIWQAGSELMLVLAVIAIVSAHYINFRFCRVHNHAHTDDCSH